MNAESLSAVVLLTGTSSGIGLRTALELARLRVKGAGPTRRRSENLQTDHAAVGRRAFRMAEETGRSGPPAVVPTGGHVDEGIEGFVTRSGRWR